MGGSCHEFTQPVPHFLHRGPVRQYLRRRQETVYQPACGKQVRLPSGGVFFLSSAGPQFPGRDPHGKRQTPLQAAGDRFSGHPSGRRNDQPKRSAGSGQSVHGCQRHPVQICAASLLTGLYCGESLCENLPVLSVHSRNHHGSGERCAGTGSGGRKRTPGGKPPQLSAHPGNP